MQVCGCSENRQYPFRWYLRDPEKKSNEQRLARWLGSHSQFAVVVSDIKVKNMFFSIHSGKSHNIEQTLVVLDGLDANGTPLAEMFGDVVMLSIDPRGVGGPLAPNGFCKRRAVTLHVRHAPGPLLAARSNT